MQAVLEPGNEERSGKLPILFEADWHQHRDLRFRWLDPHPSLGNRKCRHAVRSSCWKRAQKLDAERLFVGREKHHLGHQACLPQCPRTLFDW